MGLSNPFNCNTEGYAWYIPCTRSAECCFGDRISSGCYPNPDYPDPFDLGMYYEVYGEDAGLPDGGIIGYCGNVEDELSGDWSESDWLPF